MNHTTGSDAVQAPPGRERISLILTVSPEANEVLELLGTRYDWNKGDVLNVAVGLLKQLSDAAAEGKRAGIAAEGQALETELDWL